MKKELIIDCRREQHDQKGRGDYTSVEKKTKQKVTARRISHST